MAARLIEAGFEIVRPLAGGFDAWVDAGYPVEDVEEDSLAEASAQV